MALASTHGYPTSAKIVRFTSNVIRCTRRPPCLVDITEPHRQLVRCVHERRVGGWAQARHHRSVTRPVPTRVLHMTRIERLPSVIEHGLLPDNACIERHIAGVEIGYDHIKRRRARRDVPCGVGGTLADYVPFYFAPRSPMLFAITCGNVSVEAARTKQIVYLISSTQTLRQAGLTVLASNRHAELDYAEITDQDGDLDGDEFIDWPLMKATYWNNTPQDPDRKERRQAECLVSPSVPWQAIEGVATKTETVCAQVKLVLGTAGQPTPVAVRPQWYF